MDSDIEGPSGQGLNSELQKPHEEVKFKYDAPLTLPHTENDFEKAVTAPAKLFAQQNTGIVS